jgi:hypothetical protein
MRIASCLTGILVAAIVAGSAQTGSAQTGSAEAETPDCNPAGPLGSVLRRLRDGLPGTPAPSDHPIVGIPEPAGTAITGRDWVLRPSEQLKGREAALRFRFQQHLTGERPWLPRTQPE